MKTTFDPRVNDIRYVEAEGFRAGANSVPIGSGLKEIAALFARRKKELEEQAAPVIRALEARAKTLRTNADEASQWWESLKQKHGDDVPRWFGPLILLITSIGAIAAEAVLLAPMLDMVGVADPEHQLWLAVGIIMAASGLFHWCLNRRKKNPQQLWPLALAGAILVGLAFVGLFRAEQMAFAAAASGSLFGEFLRQHPTLRAGVFVFLTLLFPAAATLVPHAALDEIHYWWQYRRARGRADRLPRQANQAEKVLEGAKEKLQHQLVELDEKADEWKASYETFYHLGKEVGARQRPYWTIWARSGAVAGLAFLGMVAAAYLIGMSGLAAFVLSVVLAASAGLAAAAYFHRRWAHPSAREYLKLANLRFRNSVEVTQSLRLPSGNASTGVPDRVYLAGSDNALSYGDDEQETLEKVS